MHGVRPSDQPPLRGPDSDLMPPRRKPRRGSHATVSQLSRGPNWGITGTLILIFVCDGGGSHVDSGRQAAGGARAGQVVPAAQPFAVSRSPPGGDRAPRLVHEDAEGGAWHHHLRQGRSPYPPHWGAPPDPQRPPPS